MRSILRPVELLSANAREMPCNRFQRKRAYPCSRRSGHATQDRHVRHNVVMTTPGPGEPPLTSLTWLRMRFVASVLNPIPYAMPGQALDLEMRARFELPADHRFVVLPAMLHGAIGRELHQRCCFFSDPRCRCDHERSCAFGLVFERPDGRPSPLRLDPISRAPENGVYYAPGERFEFSFTLAGTSRIHAAAVEDAVRAAGLAGFGPRDFLGPGKARFEVHGVSPEPGSLEPQPAPRAARASFLTPFIPSGADGLGPPPFTHLWRATVFRVVRQLDVLYGDGQWRHALPSRGLDAQVWGLPASGRYETWRLHFDPSAPVSPRQFVQGFTGDMTYEGAIADFWPLLKLGEALGIGRETALGCGGVAWDPAD